MSKYSVKKPVTVLMCILIVVVLGLYSLTKQSLGLFPDMNLPYVVVVTPYAGASAEDVVEDVTSVVESQVTSMNNFSAVSSTSNQHFSIVMVEFNDGTNMDSVMIDLRSKLDNLTFPEGVTKPTILQISPDMLPVMTVSVSVDIPNETDQEQQFIKATQYVSDELITRFSRIEGVAEVSMTGAADVLVKIDLDDALLANYGVNTDQVLTLIQEQNHNELVGVALNKGEICMLHLGNAVESIDELRNLPLPLTNVTTGEKEVVKLINLTKEDGIKFIDNNAESYSKVNGKKTITLSFQMQNGAVITDVTNNITEELNKVMEENPNFSYNVVLDQGEYINMAVGSVIENLIYGALLAIVVLLLFLKDLRPTLIVGLSIPISVIATFMCMFFMGINLNMLSMGGLALGIGMLVDNAIVVIENIFRLRKEGKGKVEAAIEGAKGVASAITSSTITTIVVFIPILFLGGTVQDVFENMAYTIAFSLICSLVIALTMVPAMASKMLNDPNHCPKCETEVTKDDKECPNCGKKLRHPKPKKIKYVCKSCNYKGVYKENEDAIIECPNCKGEVKEADSFETKFNRKYEKVIRWSLSHKLIVLLSAVILFIISGALVLSKGFVLLPSTDEGSISATVTLKEDIDFATASNYTDNLVEDIREISDEIETVSASFGTSTGIMSMISTSNEVTQKISLNIKLKADHKKSTLDHANEIKKIIENFNTEGNLELFKMEKDDVVEMEVQEASSSMTALTASGVNVKVKGYDLEKMEKVATKLAEIAASVEGVKEASSGVSGSQNNLKIYVNKENAAKVGLTEQDFIDSIGLFLNMEGLSLMTGENTLKLNFNNVEYEIEVPSTMSIGSIGLNNIMNFFGTYEEFLVNFVVFDKKMLAAIKEANIDVYTFIPVDENKQPIYDMTQFENMRSIIVKVNPTIYYNPNTNEFIDITPFLNDFAQLGQIMATHKPLEEFAAGRFLGAEDDPNAISYIKPVTGYSSIASDGKYRYFNVSAKIEKGYNVTKVSSEVNEKINEYLDSEEFKQYDEFITIEFAGENEDIMEVVSQMFLALLIGILLVYMVMAIQFQSITYPFIILGTLPLAFTGGFLFILIFGMEFSIVVIMGLIVLVGVAVNNGIVLIDYINQLRSEGYTIRDACAKASVVRLRPILMTALTTIVALIFSAIGVSNGAELLQPLALTSIGGLLFATILTLIIIPCMYMIFNFRKVKREERK